MSKFLCSNDWTWRLARTMVQGVLGVLTANIDTMLGVCVLDPEWRAIAVALVMALLTPIMAELGAMDEYEAVEVPRGTGAGSGGAGSGSGGEAR